MEENKKNEFVVINEEGKEIKCEVLFTFDSDETKKSYIVYTDNTLDDEGNTKVYASTFDPKNDDTHLGPIETEKEWKIIEAILGSIQDEVDKANKESEGSGQQ